MQPPEGAQAPEAFDGGRAQPETPEERLARQLRKRWNAVLYIRRTFEYQVYRWALSQGLAAPMREPDPEELPPISKRDWEKGIQNWRHALRQIQGGTEDLLFLRTLLTA